MGFAMNAKIIKIVCLVLSESLFFILIISCSSMNNILSWPKFLSSREAKIAQFFSNVRAHQGNPDSHYLLACYYQERGRYKEALEEFKKVLLIDPCYVKAYNGMGVSFDLLRDFPRAIESYEIALKLNPNLDYVQNNLGYSYLLQENFDEAITYFKKAIVLNDKDGRFHNNLGLAYAEKGQFDLALAEFRTAGDEANAHYNMAKLYFKKGLYDEAKSHYAMALNLNPSLTIVRTGLKAADALARVFQPISIKAEPKQLIIPDQPIIRIAEMKKPVASDQPATVKADAEKEVIHNKSTDEYVEAKELITINQPPIQMVKTEDELVALDQRAEIKQLSSFKDVRIEISNGNGVNRMARKVGDYLKERGLKVTRLTNANSFNHAETRILYQKGFYEAADYTADQLPVIRNMEELKKFDRPNIKIKILIGKDLIPHHKLFKNGRNS